MSALEEKLLDDAEEGPSFGVKNTWLMGLFEKENRSDDHDEVPKSRTEIKNIGDHTGLLRAVKSRENYGIEGTKEDLAERVAKFGSNTRREVATKSISEMICEQFDDKILRILIVAALVSL